MADKVTSQGFKDEGMYDAVTSATTTKSKRFNATYFEEHDNGVNILGVKDVDWLAYKDKSFNKETIYSYVDGLRDEYTFYFNKVIEFFRSNNQL